MNFFRGVVKDGILQISEDGGEMDARFDLSPILASDIMEKYNGKELVLGFRPESVLLQQEDDCSSIKCDVELTELLGDNTNVYVNIGKSKAVLKVDPHDTPEMDTELIFYIPNKSIYLFDSETEDVVPTIK